MLNPLRIITLYKHISRKSTNIQGQETNINDHCGRSVSVRCEGVKLNKNISFKNSILLTKVVYVLSPFRTIPLEGTHRSTISFQSSGDFVRMLYVTVPSFPPTSRNKLKVLVAVCFRLIRNFMFTHCSKFYQA
jgi:hypothetical protein